MIKVASQNKSGRVVGSGWAALAQAIRQLDGEKIRDCKEDIESMLAIRMTERGVNKDVRPSLAISSGDIQFTMLGNTLE